MKRVTKLIIFSIIFVIAITISLTQVYPALELTFSIAIRLLSALIAIVLIFKYKDFRVAFLALMFFLMASRQTLTLLLQAEIIEQTRVSILLSEVPGFIVTLLALSSIIFVGGILFKLRESNEKVLMMENFLSICSYCKKIKDEKEIWIQPEAYIKKHKETEFSHGLCPECFKREMEILNNDR
jgi:hypothetical protein